MQLTYPVLKVCNYRSTISYVITLKITLNQSFKQSYAVRQTAFVNRVMQKSFMF